MPDELPFRFGTVLERNGTVRCHEVTTKELRRRARDRASRLFSHAPLCWRRHRQDLRALADLAMRADFRALSDHATVQAKACPVGATSFPWRFCASCGRQIEVFTDRALYCSSTCRTRGRRGGPWVSTTEAVLRKYGLTLASAWRTPPALVAWCAERWGPFALDAAALPGHQVCEAYIPPWDDAFVTAWAERAVGLGNYFLNPPYAREAGRAELGGGLLSWFRLAHERALEAERNVIVVAPSGDGAEYAHLAASVGREIVHLAGRQAHLDPETGRASKGTRFGTSIFVLGVRPSHQTRALETRARIAER